MSPHPHILIAGAGIGGLTATLALIRRGYRVSVLEQARELAEIGAGVQISANGAQALFSLGLEAALEAVWCEPAGKEIRLWSTGETWKLFDLGAVSRQRYGAPYFMIHRADLHRILLDVVQAAAPDAIRLNCRVAGFEQTASSVTAICEDGARIEGDALIGADGVHSRVRNALFGQMPAQFTGLMIWRGLVPMESLPQRMQRLVGTNWVGPGGHVVHYPVRGGTLMNVGGAIEHDDWRVESWTERGTTEEALNDFPGWNEDVHTLIRNIEVPYKWALLGREPLERWTIGRVTLLGDAAHPTLPMMAQGANMALEDAVVLARCLDAYDDVPAALQAYEEARRERTARLVRAANDNAGRFHNPALGNAEGAARYVDTEWQEAKVKQRYDWVFEYDPVTTAV
ncbi:FAD-dependent monooxygenase [Pseudorhodoplanes sp.]|uniref:FAD-dependent monooxygenase n=1 Tax=Pseudorhodoplanes sp. TaxID=1934341 RepID=UPI002BAA3FC9|nr:FAD-dependent monooxygenase [Pseudorhodoplanes sp.]HWV51541.1 FAD-dependent monooxygenase [Pseudorhodoplanes sp.]